MSEWHRFPVSPGTMKVLGYKVKADSPMWAGLNLARADLIVQSTLMMRVCGHDAAPFDLHLNVPWCHPEDQTGDPSDWDDCKYRIRPKMEVGKKWKGRIVDAVFFELWAGEWRLAVLFKSKAARGVPKTNRKQNVSNAGPTRNAEEAITC